jgi:membrane protein insertase Oxa1/YidC/SpoIIIJ
LEFATGGALWFNNLAVPDVWYGLPLITAVANLANLELNGLGATRPQVSGSPSAPAQQQQQQDPETPGEGRSGLTWSDPVDNKVMRDHAVRGFVRLLSISMVWIGTQLPAGVCFYWCVSACYGVVQNLAFLFPGVRRAAAIPRTSSEVDRPMADLAAKARKEWATFFADLKRYN